MGTFIDDAVTDITGRISGAMEGMYRLVEQDSKVALLRRFRRSYGKLSVGEIMGIRDTLGHAQGEQQPCKVCRIMATEEFRLSQEQE